jgi:predicted enzyme related to lactoylglutathione lyase
MGWAFLCSACPARNLETHILSTSISETSALVIEVPRVVHFEIDAEKPERAIKFYEKVFGWKIEKWKGPIDYWLVMTGNEKEPGIDGGLGKRTEAEPSTVNTIDVPLVDEYVKTIVKNGGSIVRPKMPVPGVGWMAYFKDPEGNLWGIMQIDINAK